MLEINFKEVNSVAVISLSGSIDINCANFIEMVGWCLNSGYKDILCDFSDVNMLDYSGLSVLTIAYRDAVNYGARMKLMHVAVHIKKLFSMVYLDAVFEVYEDEDLAINSFKEDRAISKIQKMPLRRRFKRLPLDIDVEFRAVDKKGQPYNKGKVLNISAVGMLIFAEYACPLGQILDVRLPLSPKPGVIEMEAKVAWLVQKEIQPQIYPGMGMEFYNLSSSTQKKIIEFVDRNLPLSCTSEDS